MDISSAEIQNRTIKKKDENENNYLNIHERNEFITMRE